MNLTTAYKCEYNPVIEETIMTQQDEINSLYKKTWTP